MAEAMATVSNNWTPESSKYTTMTKPSEFPPTPVEATDTDFVDSTAGNDHSTQFKEENLENQNASPGLPAPAKPSSDLSTVPPSAQASPRAKYHDDDLESWSSSVRNGEFDLARGVSDFLTQIRPWVSAMPEQLRTQCQVLQERAHNAPGVAKPESYYDAQ